MVKGDAGPITEQVNGRGAWRPLTANRLLEIEQEWIRYTYRAWTSFSVFMLFYDFRTLLRFTNENIDIDRYKY